MRPLIAAIAVAAGVSFPALAFPALAQAAPPQVEATWTTEVAATSAKLHAEINPEGATTNYHFNYLTEAAYQKNLNEGKEAFTAAAKAPPGVDPAIGPGEAETVYQSLGNLLPQTTYRYRVVAGSVESTVHAFTTEGFGGSSLLLDHRGWEMVSPIDKNGGQVQGPGQNFGGDVLQAAAQGGAATYSSSASFGEGALGAPTASQYLATRTSGGWSTANLSAPLIAPAEPEAGGGVPYRLFSEDLSAALLYSGGSCLKAGEGCADPSPPLPGSGAPAEYQDYYLRNDDNGTYQALISAADAPELGHILPEAFEVRLAGATPDLRHVVLTTCAKLSPEATEQPVCDSGGPNLYEWSGGVLGLINRLGDDSLGTPDAHLAAQAGAISSDGSRIYFTDGEQSFLYLREGEAGAKLVSAEPAVSFQTASADGSVAFFTKGGELFRYEAQAETSERIATGVQGVLGASEEGSYVYYLGAGGLMLWHAGTTTEVAPGAQAAASTDWPPATGTARISADGTHLLFTSTASLTGYDNTDQASGEPDSEVYLYDADGNQLTCVSCNPTGERPLGPSTIPGAIANGQGAAATLSFKPRDLSENAGRVFFDSSDSLVLRDTDNRQDVYEWEAQGAGTCTLPGGCIGLISSGRSGEGSEFVDASADGADAFFLTEASLVPDDPGSADLYDAREGGGLPVPVKPIECDGDSCQSLPSEPEDLSPGTLLSGPSNPSVHFPSEHPKKSHHKKRRRSHHKRAARHRGGRR